MGRSCHQGRWVPVVTGAETLQPGILHQIQGVRPHWDQGDRSCTVVTDRRATGRSPVTSKLACVHQRQALGSVPHLNLPATQSTL